MEAAQGEMPVGPTFLSGRPLKQYKARMNPRAPSYGIG